MYFDDKDNLIIGEDDTHVFFIPARHCQLIFLEMRKGKRWWEASTVYPISRETAAFILTNFPKNKKDKEKRRKDI